MATSQYSPIPPDLFGRACQTISAKVSRLPFQRRGVLITPELVGAAIEYLNAEPARTLPVTTPRDAPENSAVGLDRLLEERMQVEGKKTAPVVSEVLADAGIADPARVLDRPMRCQRNAVRLLSPWTWHIASPATAWSEDGPAHGAPDVSWTNLCAVCREGSLGRVEGKQLFGVPRTDFFLECSHCGARFIPVGPAYRLVSIRSIRDPLWKKHLDATHTGDEWAAIARGASPNGNPLQRKMEIRPAGPAMPAPVGGSLGVTKDGSLAVPIGGMTLYFRPVPLRFFGSVKGSAFIRMQATLAELVSDPAFSNVRDQITVRYANYLPLKAGLFMQHLMERHDSFYTRLLNPFGDEKYGTFRAGDVPGIDKPGILLVVVNRGIYHACSCPESFGTTISQIFGRVAPEHCFLNGDPVRCRINAVLCTNRETAGLFMYGCGEPKERDRILSSLPGADENKQGVSSSSKRQE